MDLVESGGSGGPTDQEVGKWTTDPVQVEGLRDIRRVDTGQYYVLCMYAQSGWRLKIED